MSILDELQVGLVPLLQGLQQQLVLGPLPLQLPYLRQQERQRGGWEAGRLGPWGSLPARTVTPPITACLHPHPGPDPHLGLQLFQPRLALQKLGLELGGATLKLHLRGQELLLVSCAREQGLRRRDMLPVQPGRALSRAQLPRAPCSLSLPALHLTGGCRWGQGQDTKKPRKGPWETRGPSFLRTTASHSGQTPRQTLRPRSLNDDESLRHTFAVSLSPATNPHLQKGPGLPGTCFCGARPPQAQGQR